MSDYFPVEVILEILKRLPVKSLVKCRSVCKNWNTLICNPSFISTHLQASLSNPNSPLLLLRCLKNGKENYFLHYDNDDFDEFKQLQFPLSGCISYCFVVGSCNGLICLNFLPQDVLNFIFWNPSVHKYISLPEPGICWDTNDVRLNFGFGFDSRTNDYKLLIVGVEKDETLIEPFLFSLNQNSWKRVVTSISPKYAVEANISSTFVSGAVHWLGYQRGNNGGFSNTILGFDLSGEEFFEISLPESLVGLCPMDLSTMKYEESSIAVLKRDWEDGELLDLWVMKEYGVVESWTKVLALHVNDQSGWFPRVLGFRKNGEVLLQVDDGEMASLDLNCQQMEPQGVEVGAGLLSVGSYVESLVLIDKAVDGYGVSDVNHVVDSSDSDDLSE